jgi:hypothetical protein
MGFKGSKQEEMDLLTNNAWERVCGVGTPEIKCGRSE